jgi:hypothetical protein
MTMKPRKAFALRIDPELFVELEGWAQQEFRSVNGQIEFILREAVSRRRGSRDAATAREPADQSPKREDRRVITKRIEIVDRQVARILAEKSEAQRLQAAWGMWRFAQRMITQLVRAESRGSSEDHIRQEIARRLANGS